MSSSSSLFVSFPPSSPFAASESEYSHLLAFVDCDVEYFLNLLHSVIIKFPSSVLLCGICTASTAGRATVDECQYVSFGPFAAFQGTVTPCLRRDGGMGSTPLKRDVKKEQEVSSGGQGETEGEEDRTNDPETEVLDRLLQTCAGV